MIFSALKLFGSAFSKRFASTLQTSSRSVTRQHQNIIRIHVNSMEGLLDDIPRGMFKSGVLSEIANLNNEIHSQPSLILTSVLRKRRLKMKKHKLRKRRKAQRALKIKIGK